MRLTTDEDFANMDLNEVQQKLRNLWKFSDNSETLEELLIKLKKRIYPLFCILAWWFDDLKSQSPSDTSDICKCFIWNSIFLSSDEEYYLKYKKNINVQATIEEPQLYLLRRCPSNNEQILYSVEKIGDLFKKQKPIQRPNGTMINDIAKLLKGDSPAR